MAHPRKEEAIEAINAHLRDLDQKNGTSWRVVTEREMGKTKALLSRIVEA